MKSIDIPMNCSCSIVISTRNRPSFLEDSLAHLRNAGFDRFPLWIYDDASDDANAVTAVCQDWPVVTLVRGEVRRGQAYGRNVLLNRCDTEFAVMLDDDQYFEEAAHLPSYLGKPAAAESPIAVVAFQSIRVGDSECSIHRKTETGPASSFMGGACLFHVPSVLSVGAYREFFIYGWEEPELAIRLWLNGFRVLYDRRVILAHNHQLTANANRDLREYDYLYARNIVLTHTMNFGLWYSLAIGVLKSLKFSAGKGRHHFAGVRGCVDGFLQTLRHWRERNPASWKRYRERHAYERDCRGIE